MKHHCLIVIVLSMASVNVHADDEYEEVNYLESERISNLPPAFKYKPFIEFEPSERGASRANIITSSYIPAMPVHALLRFSITQYLWQNKEISLALYFQRRSRSAMTDLSTWPRYDLPLFPEIEDDQNWRWRLPMQLGFENPVTHLEYELDVR